MKCRPGSTLGPYRILELIGAGAMGEVYRALDPRLQREVAIKVLSAPHVSPEAMARFTTEARAVAAMSHPNVVAIFDVGELDGLPYAVMELLDGETLHARLARGALPPDEAAAVARQIASGLEAAHEKQIVHRDLKPANIFVLKHGAVKLVDFGIARMAVPGDLETTRVTTHGLIVGTIGYMAPEQARGQEADARADLFAFGAVLYEMVTGARAFDGDSAIDVLASIVGGDTPTFAATSPLQNRFGAIIAKCLRRDPATRFQHARDVLRALEPGDAEFGAAPAAAGPRELTSIAVLPFADMSQARDQEYLCEGLAEELITAMSQIPRLKVASRTAAFRFRDQTMDVRQVGAMLGVECVLEGSVRTSGHRLRVTARLTMVADGYLLWTRQFDRELGDIFAVQDEMARLLVDTLQPERSSPAATMIHASTGAAEAYTEYLKGRYHWNRRSESGLVAAIGHFTRAIELDPGYGQGYAGLADAHATLALYGLRRPHDVMPIARAMAEKALGLTPDLPEAHVSLALVESVYEWAWAESETHFQKAVSLAPSQATAFHWYASNCLVPRGRFEDARRALDRAAALDPVSLPVMTSVGLLAYYEGDFERARESFQRAIALDPGFAPAHGFLAQALAECGQAAEAIAHGDTAVTLSGGAPEALAGLGCVAAITGSADRATAVLDRLNALAAERYVSPGLIAQVHAALGQETAAIACLQAALDLHASDLAWLGVRPVWRTLHRHPAFIRFAERLGVSICERPTR